MRIAVCDDEEIVCAQLADLVHSWAESRHIPVQLHTFASGSAFLFCWQQDKDWDALLLDIEMPGESGLATARQLRQDDSRVAIIFVTGYDAYMAKGYDVQALHYLIKPVEQQKLFSVLDRAAAGRRHSAAVLLLPTPQGTLKVAADEIFWAEAQGHYTDLHTAGGMQQVQLGIAQLQNELQTAAPDTFFACHRSYLVNLDQIELLGKLQVQLRGGTVLPVSRRVARQLSSAFWQRYRRRDGG